MEAYFSRLFKEGVGEAVANISADINVNFYKELAETKARLAETQVQLETVRNSKRKIGLIDGGLKVFISNGDGGGSEDESGEDEEGGERGEGHRRRDPSEPRGPDDNGRWNQAEASSAALAARLAGDLDEFTLQDLCDLLLGKIRQAHAGRYMEYNRILSAVDFPVLANPAQGNRDTELEFRNMLFRLKYNPSFEYCMQLAVAFNLLNKGTITLNKRRGTGSKGRKAKKSKLSGLGDLQQPIKIMAIATPSSWFLEFLSVYEQIYRHLDTLSSSGSILPNMQRLRTREDMPTPRMFDDVFYVEETGKRVTQIGEGRDAEEITSAHMESFKMFAMDIPNLLTVFSHELFGSLSFIPEPVDEHMLAPDRFTDLQLLVEFALLLDSSSTRVTTGGRSGAREGHLIKFKEYLQSPALFVLDPSRKRYLVQALDRAVQFLLTSFKGFVFVTDNQGQIQLNKIQTPPGLGAGGSGSGSGGEEGGKGSDGGGAHATLVKVSVPSMVCDVFQSVQLPNLLLYRKSVDNLLPFHSTVEEMISTHGMIQLQSKISLLLNFNLNSVGEMRKIFNKILLKQNPGATVDSINLNEYADIDMLQSWQDLYFTLVTASANIKACKPSHSTGDVDSARFVEKGIWPLADRASGLGQMVPSDSSLVAFNSTFNQATGLLFYSILGIGETMGDGDLKLGMTNPGFFRKKQHRDPTDIPATQSGISRQAAMSRVNLSRIPGLSGMMGGGGETSRGVRSQLDMDEAPIRHDRRLLFALFDAFSNRIPPISKAHLEKRVSGVSQIGISMENLSRVDPVTGIEGPRAVGGTLRSTNGKSSVASSRGSIQDLISNMSASINVVKASHTNNIALQLLARHNTSKNVLRYFMNQGTYATPIDSELLDTELFQLEQMYADTDTGRLSFFALPLAYRHSTVSFVPEDSERVVIGSGLGFEASGGAREGLETLVGSIIQQRDGSNPSTQHTFIPNV